MTVVLFLRDGGAKTPCKRCSCSVIQSSGLLPREGGLISPRRWPEKSVQAAFSVRNLQAESIRAQSLGNENNTDNVT